MVEYLCARLLARLAVSKQNHVAIIWITLCAVSLAIFPTNIVVTNCFVLLAALFGGVLLSRQIGSIYALLAMLSVAAIVDVISTYAGPTRWIADQAQRAHSFALIQFLAVSLQMNGKLVGVIGVADLMFFTVCVSVLSRLGESETRAFAVPLLGILSALVAGLFAGLMPALPFLAGAVMLYVWLSPPSTWKTRGS